MRMTAYHFFVYAGGDVIEGEISVFGGDLCMHDDLEKQISEFFAHVRFFVEIDRFDKFSHFFNHAAAKGAMRLFPIPRASVGRAQSGNGVYQIINGSHVCVG